LHKTGHTHGSVSTDALFYASENRRYVIGNFLTLGFDSSLLEQDIANLGTMILEQQSYPLMGNRTPFFAWDKIASMAKHMCNEKSSLEVYINDDIFQQNPLIQVLENFLKKFIAIPVHLKVKIFNQLPSELRKIPKMTLETLILPHLLSKELFLEVGSLPFYRVLFGCEYSLNSDPLFSKEVFYDTIIPFSLTLFSQRIYEIRISLFRIFDLLVNPIFEWNRGAFDSFLIGEVNMTNEDITWSGR
jgi:hypothetical protein